MVRIGFGLPIAGSAATQDGIRQVATRAEALGFDSLWVWERLFWATNPQNEYPGTPGQPQWPDYFKSAMDPLTAITAAAAHTERVELGTSVLIFGNYNPVDFARRVATIDILSGGRLKLGLGSGWSVDEHQAMGVDYKTRGRRADEFITVVKGLLSGEPFAHKGEFFDVPENLMIQPVQKPHPPLLLAAYAPATMQRAAAQANGWTPVGVPLDAMAQMHQGMRDMVQGAGGNPDDFQLAVRANFVITPAPLEERFPFIGSLEQIKQDYETSVAAGATEIFFDPSFGEHGKTVDGYLESMEIIKNQVI